MSPRLWHEHSLITTLLGSKMQKTHLEERKTNKAQNMPLSPACLGVNIYPGDKTAGDDL